MQIERTDDVLRIAMSVDDATKLKRWIEVEAPSVAEGWKMCPADPGEFPIEELYGLLDSEI